MTELLFERERALRSAACNYSNVRSGALRDAKEVEDTRKALRAAALAYAQTAREIDECFAEESQS